ncbi:hypothetical protein Bca101_034974 [Brassica carinata]
MNSTDLTALAPDSEQIEIVVSLTLDSSVNLSPIIEPWRLGDGYKEFFLDAPDSVKGPNNQGHWLVKSIQCVLDILKNADSNAEGCWCLSHCFPPYPFHGSQYIVWWGLQDLGLQQVSVVWEGRHLVDGTVVAIKEIAMTEIFILRKINHPNIIHFIDMIETSMFPKMSQACLTNFWMVAASEETSSSRDGRDGKPAMILQPALARSRQISLPLPEESLKHKMIDKCMVHMHKFHGFFIPDIEYLKDHKGFLTYVDSKGMLGNSFVCYCNELCHPFTSLEAVRKHMEAKSQCKVHYGDEEDADLEESELLLSESSAFPCLNSYCLDLLLGLLREGEGVAARVLENLGVDASNIRTQL